MHPELYRQFFEIEDHYWWSVGTRRLFRELVAPLAGPGRRALDVGCGTGAMLRELAPEWPAVSGCDYSAAALAYCRERGLRSLVRCDATHLPYRSASFDLLTALDVVEHLDDDLGCVRELARICRPGGHVLLHVPAHQVLWSDKDELNQHRRRYSRAALFALLEAAGLQIVRHRYLNVAMLPAALARSLWQRHSGVSPSAEQSAASVERLYRIPARLNAALTAMMDTERWLGRHLPLPPGMSIACLATKPICE